MTPDTGYAELLRWHPQFAPCGASRDAPAAAGAPISPIDGWPATPNTRTVPHCQEQICRERILGQLNLPARNRQRDAARSLHRQKARSHHCGAPIRSDVLTGGVMNSARADPRKDKIAMA